MAMFCLTIGCAPAPGKLQEVRLPPKRIVQLGYSILPPDDRGWYVRRRTPTFVAMVKQGKGPDESIAIEASAHPFSPPPSQDAAASVLPDPEADIASRFRQLALDVKTDDERPDCKRVHAVSEDRAPARRSGSKAPMILETLLLTCAHPEDRALGIDVLYSHRYEPGRRDPDFDAKAIGLLKAVQFTDVGEARDGGENVR
jgi:hypothetical protein